MVLVGFHEDDESRDMEYIINKITGLRVFDDDSNVMNCSVSDVNGEVLLVPQFTLYGDVRKGKRPSYSSAMKPERARGLFDDFLARFRSKYDRVSSGVFGADMRVSLVNWGPVTILLDSSKIL
jgi:D-tyrosyl-tRNA(Tyr) deacylase